jgi:hypothetical protein
MEAITWNLNAHAMGASPPFSDKYVAVIIVGWIFFLCFVCFILFSVILVFPPQFKNIYSWSHPCKLIISLACSYYFVIPLFFLCLYLRCYTGICVWR